MQDPRYMLVTERVDRDGPTYVSEVSMKGAGTTVLETQEPERGLAFDTEAGAEGLLKALKEQRLVTTYHVEAVA